MTNNNTGNGQLIVITGARGVGKTLAASTYNPPDEVDKVFYIDSEKSANNFREELKGMNKDFGFYLDMQDRFGNLPGDDDLLSRINKGQLPWVDQRTRSGLVDYYLHIVGNLRENLKPNQYTTVVVDTIEKMEAGMAAWVEKNKSAAGVTTMAYGKLWTEGVYPLYEQLLASIFARGVTTIIFTSHLRTPWEGNRPVAGKVEPSGKKILYFLSRFMIWLVHNSRNFDGAPAGLVLKERLANVSVKNGDWDISRRIPSRIPHFTWTDVRRYMKNGCDLKNPPSDEVPTEDERALITDMITDKQMELMLIEARKELIQSQQSTSVFSQPAQSTAEAKSEEPSFDVIAQTVQEIIEEGYTSAKVVRDKIENRLGIELPIPTVLKHIREAKSAA